MLIRLIIGDFFRFIRHWRLFFLYCLLIYVSLPEGPKIWAAFEHFLGAFGKNLPYTIISLAFIGAILRFLMLNKQYLIQGLFMIVLVFSISFLILRNLEYPAERMHLIEYMLLAIIIYSRMNKDQPIMALHFKILAIGFIVGALDEGIQYFIPGRVCDFRDVILNAASVSLGQMLLYAVEHLC